MFLSYLKEFLNWRSLYLNTTEFLFESIGRDEIINEVSSYLEYKKEEYTHIILYIF
jgi:hypothetical protein